MKKIFVAGHNGMVGSAICRLLVKSTDIKVVTRSRSELDLTDQAAVMQFFKSERPDEVILAAAKVGGIHANSTSPAEFIFQNLQIQNNVIHSSHLNDVQKLLNLGSSCIYPKFASQPIDESSILTGVLEPTNEPYAIAKIAGIKMCESYNRQYGRDYRSVMPTNLYGPGDNYHPLNSHVVPALIQKFHMGKVNGEKEVSVWGSGSPLREFLFVDDMADGCLHFMNIPKQSLADILPSRESHINIGFGADIAIGKLAKIISEVVGYQGSITFDQSKPDGTPKKLLNSQKINDLGWRPKVTLREGLQICYQDFKARATDV